MARKATPLTDTKIKKLKKPGKFYDGGGLYLQVMKSGSKLWRLRYRSPLTGKETTMALGSYPATSLKQARQKREEALHLIEQGNDPIAKKEEAQHTFANAVDGYLTRLKGEVSKSHYKRTASILNKYAMAVLGDRAVDSITDKDLIPLLDRVKEAGHYETARKLFSAFRGVFSFAYKKGWTESNPARSERFVGEFPKKTKKHHAALTTKAELTALLEAIRSYDGWVLTRLALEFGLLTALRVKNIRGLKWEMVDLEARLVTIPRKLMKVKSGDDFRLPLSDRAVVILEEAKLYSGHYQHVFASPLGDRPLSSNTPRNALRRMGYTNEQVTVHGFRSSFSTVCNDEKPGSKDAVEAALDHATGSTIARAYDRGDRLAQRRELMQWWADYLDEVKG